MLRPGQLVILARIRQVQAVVRVKIYDPRGYWIGLEIGKRWAAGRGDVDPIRAFKGSEVRAAKTKDGYRAVLPGVVP